MKRGWDRTVPVEIEEGEENPWIFFSFFLFIKNQRDVIPP